MAATVLVVDDSVDVTTTVSKLLKRDGLTVLGAINVQEANERLSQNAIDLIILDIGLGGDSGFAFCSELQKNPKTASIPVVFLTGSIQTQDQVTAFAMGAEDFISKVDFNPEHFKARIESRLKKIEQFKQAQAQKKNQASAGSGTVGSASDRLTVDLKAMKAFSIDGKTTKDLALSPVEVKILSVLMSHENQILNRTQIIEQAGLSDEFNQHHGDSHFIDSEAASLKRKLGPALSMCVQNILGLGYRYVKGP